MSKLDMSMCKYYDDSTIFDMDFNDGSPTGHSGSGEFGASLFEGFMRGLLRR